MEIPFRWKGVEGTARVEVRANDDPTALGCPEIAAGFPYCSAKLEPAGTGYQHLSAWLQLVDQREGGGFEVDQYPPLADVSHPFVFFGYSPRFFDGPYSDEREDWDFLAHAFYCGFGGELSEFRREACAIFGFRWGFSKRGSRFEFLPLGPLSAEDWGDHRDYLERKYSGWTFAPGFSQRSLRP